MWVHAHPQCDPGDWRGDGNRGGHGDKCRATDDERYRWQHDYGNCVELSAHHRARRQHVCHACSRASRQTGAWREQFTIRTPSSWIGGNNSNDMDGSMNVYTPSAAGDTTGGLVNSYVTATGGGGPTGVMPTPVDSIEEFKVGTNNQTADFNSSSGAQVQMVTKRGGNQWHGTAYEYYLDNNWSGNTWDNNAGGSGRPSYNFNRFGASGGGPGHPEVNPRWKVVPLRQLRGLPLAKLHNVFQERCRPTE